VTHVTVAPAATMSGPVAASDATDGSPQLLVEQGHFKRARAAVDAALTINPADAESLYLSARVRLAFGDAEEALVLAEKAGAANPRSAACQFLIARTCGEVARRAGGFRQIALGRRVKAEAERAIAIDPRQIDARNLLIVFHANAPGLIGGDRNKAQQMVDAIAHLDATQGLLARARLAEQLRDPAQAEASYLEAVRANPDSFEGHAGLARIYASDDHRNPALAEQHALELVRLQPARISGYSLLATHYAAEQRMTDLDDILSRASRAIPDDLGPWFQAGRALTAEGAHLDVAEQYLRQYLAQDTEAGEPTLAEAHWRLGLILEARGRRSEALQALQTAVRLQPDLQGATTDLKRLQET
jgi:tetratricopeptide (TPR) repeat protein